MKILIVSVPLEFPLAGYCLAARLADASETKRHHIQLLTLNTSKLNTYNQKNGEIWRYIAHVESTHPDIITFSIYLWNILIIRELISLTNKLYPDTHIIIGGPEVGTSEVIEQFLAGGEVTAAVRGEGEATLVEIVRRLEQSENPQGVSGCSWRNGGTVIHEPDRPGKTVLNYPSPYLTGWISENLFDRFEGSRLKKGVFPRALVETYRGCYMKCSYCQWGNGDTSRSKFAMARVCEELTWVLSRNIARLFIIDAMFGYSLRAAKQILEHILKEKQRYQSNTEIVCYHNQDYFDHELFDLYRDAGISVELDMQSTNEKVLKRLGRRRWSTGNFDRCLQSFREHKVKTTGSADLIIGLPGDQLSSFEESIDFLLRRGLNVGLYQTSIIHGTRMFLSAKEDGIVYSDTAPRSVFKNDTFPVQEMLSARLTGHGVDFFIRYPHTAQSLWRLNSERPVDLCKNIGKKVWDTFDLMYGESWQYSSVLAGMRESLKTIVGEVCRIPECTEVITELFRLESTLAEIATPEQGKTVSVARPVPMSFFHGGDWAKETFRFQREKVEIVILKYRVDRLLALLKTGEFPAPEMWKLEEDTAVALVYLSENGQPDYQIIDRDITLELLERFNGYFTVEESLDNLLGGIWRENDMSPLWKTFGNLTKSGLLVPGIWARNHRYLEIAAKRNPTYSFEGVSG
ncbi:MAG: radical SAM protein [Geobacteraceae bacterium]|nr:radical SAM protein [Geobacteraceae bacterium]